MPISLECANLRLRLSASDLLKHNLLRVTGYLAACLIALSASCQAQANGYLYDWAPGPNSNPAPVEYGYVEQADGHLHLEIPIGEPRHNRSGSGTTQVRLVYDSNFWNPNSYFSQYSYNWEPGASWHLLPTFATYGTEGVPQTSDYYWGEVDENGVSHYFPCNWGGCYSTEGHGYWWDGGGNVYGPDGSLIMIDLLEPDGRATDANGNYTSLMGGETLPQVYGEEGELNAYDTSNTPFLEQYWVPSVGYLYHIPSMNAAGGTEDYVEHDVSIQATTAFNEARYPVAECSASDNCGLDVISQIILPDQTSFTFKYDCDSTIPAQNAYCTSPGGQAAYYGVLTEMITPTGGVYTYSYKPFFDVYGDATLGLQSRSNGFGTWQYSEAALSYCGGPSGNGTWNVGCEQTLTTVEPNGRTTITTNIVNRGAWPISELVTDGAGHNLSLTTTTWDFSNPDLFYGWGSAYIQKQSETQTLWDSMGTAETKKTAYTYDSPQKGNISILQQWGYYAGTAPSFASIADITTYTSYYTPGSTPIVDNTMWGVTKGGTNVIDKPTSITVCNNVGTDSACPGGGSRVSQELISYDQYVPAPVTGIANHDDTSYGSSQLVRGNPTTVKQWVSNSQYVTKYMTYDTTGQITSATDGNGYVTSYDYSDNYYVDNGTSSPTPYTPSAPTHAHATTMTLPTVHGHSFSTHSGYYYGDQKLAFTTDLNGNSTYYHYSDPLDRLTQTVYPLGWTMTQYTSPTQTDVYSALSSPTPSSACNADCLHASTIQDGLERVIQTVQPDGSRVDTTYNSMGLVQSVSNPYQSPSDSTYGVTSYLYDIWGRVCMQNNPDNSLSQTATCTAKGSSALQFSYIVNGGYKTDENGNTWGYFYDPLGKLASVVDPNGATTAYTHDVLGNLVGVSQPSRPRTFGYDGLSRLVTATNPESGNVCYGVWNGSNCTGGYDGNSNLISKTDARGVTTTYKYDTWNRLTSKTYSDGATSSACYQYDASGVANGNGRLSNLWTQSNSAGDCAATAPTSGFLTKRSIFAFDPMGRVWNEQQCVLGQCSSGPTPPCAASFSAPYYQSYCYDLAGNVTWSANGTTNVPSVGSIQLTQTFDWAGRPSTLTSSWHDGSHPPSLFTVNPTDGYTPSGALQDFNLGNNYIVVNKTYDNRLRVTGETAAHQ